MERTVPVRSSEEIDLYLRTIYSLLRSSNEVHIRTLEEVHAGMNSSLHTKSREDSPDISALLYALMRLPEFIFSSKRLSWGSRLPTLPAMATEMLKPGSKSAPKRAGGAVFTTAAKFSPVTLRPALTSTTSSPP